MRRRPEGAEDGQASEPNALQGENPARSRCVRQRACLLLLGCTCAGQLTRATACCLLLTLIMQQSRGCSAPCQRLGISSGSCSASVSNAMCRRNFGQPGPVRHEPGRSGGCAAAVSSQRRLLCCRCVQLLPAAQLSSDTASCCVAATPSSCSKLQPSVNELNCCSCFCETNSHPEIALLRTGCLPVSHAPATCLCKC